MKTTLLLATAGLLCLQAADPTTAVFWSASKMKEAEKKLPGKVNPETHLATERLLDSAFVLYRNGPSMGEIHDTLADFIVIREGTGAILVGGKLVNGKHTAPGEQRADSIEGGTTYQVAPGGYVLYVPANTPHQFLAEPGKPFSATIIKVTPKQ